MLAKVKYCLMSLLNFYFCGCFQGHSVNVLTIDHVTPLHEACVGDHVACARALIDAGANVSHSLASNVAVLRRSNVIAVNRENWVGVTNDALLFFYGHCRAIKFLFDCSPRLSLFLNLHG